MTVEINENSDGQVFTFTIRERISNDVVNLTAFDTAKMALISPDRVTVINNNIPMTFGSKSLGQVVYTTDPADAPVLTKPTQNYLAQVSVTGTGLAEFSELFEIIYKKDFTV